MKFLDPWAHANLKLSDHLCFAFYSANLSFGKACKPRLDALGVTYTQYITIVALWEDDNQTVGELGERLFLESNTLTPMLKKLEAMGYVKRQRGNEDERQMRILLTKSGRCWCETALKTKLSEVARMAPGRVDKVQKAIVALRNDIIRLVKHGQ
jgi:DNA-binding MarR family transcriptional regulator